MPKPYKPNNAVKADLAADFTHGTDNTITLSSTADFPPGGGYVYVEDGTEWAIYQYTGISGSDLIGLQLGTTRNESTGSYTFSSADTTVHLSITAGYMNDVVDRVNSLAAVGIEFNITQDTWQYINLNNEPLGYRPDFTAMPPWNQIKRVNMKPDGEITAFWGDDNYEHTPTDPTENVVVQIPRFYFDYQHAVESGDKKLRFKVANYPASGLEPFFSFNYGSPYYSYLGAYEGGFLIDGGSYKLSSRSGVQPWTGGQVWKVGFDAGSNEPSIGDTLSTTTEGGWIVYDYEVTSGSWAGGDAAGNLYLRKPGDDTQGWADDETITNETAGNTLATADTASVQTSIHLDIEEARDYAQNVGTGWQQNLVWGYAAHKILSMIYKGSMDFQSEVGRGIVDKAGGTGFNGELTGADSLDSQLTETNLGTAVGTGADGETPVSILWVENPYGNVRTFVDGYEAVDAAYRILRRDGEWSNAGPDVWTSSDYEISTVSPLTDDDGYISDIEPEELLASLLIPSATAGSSSEYIPDYLYSHDSGENNILLVGGLWLRGSSAGLGALYSGDGAGTSNRSLGARLEFVG